MSKRIELPIGLNTSDVAKGAKTAERALEDLDDTVEDTGKGGAKDLERIEDELKDVQKQSERASRSMDDIGTVGKGGLDKIKGGAQEVSQEIGQNLGEAVSSFSGDLSDLGQVGQDTLGGLAATLAGAGPAGLVGAAGLAAAAIGVGGVVGAMREAEEAQERLEQAASDWADAFIEAGGRIVSGAHIVAEANAIATDPERYKVAKQNAEDWGVHVSTAMYAMAGDVTALEIAQTSLNEREREWNGILTEYEERMRSSAGAAEPMTREQQELEETVKRGAAAMDEQKEAMRLGMQQFDDAARGLYEYTMRVGEATGETDDFGNAVYALPDGKKVVVDAETSTAHSNLDALENRTLQSTIKVNVDSSAWDKWQPNPKTGKIAPAIQHYRMPME